MNTHQETQNQTIEHLTRQIGRRAANLFETRQLWCSGAVLVVLNRALGGDLTQDLAVRLAAGFGKGLAGGGCVCGGLSGGVLALGLFLGRGRMAPAGDPVVLKATRRLHDKFKSAHGATCCRELLRSSGPGPRAQYSDCARRTASAAQLTAELILNQRPELIQSVDWDYLNQHENRLNARLKMASQRFKLR